MAYKYLNDNGLKAYTKKVKGALKDLHTPIAISSENTTESKAQNVRNIEDFVAKAKAAGIADVNGMAVTCLIDYDYSGVGYIYGVAAFIGITLYDDNRLFYAFIGEDGTYNQDAIIIKNRTNQVTSNMLDTGARKPIILTPSTTEVDEETYQKLLSDDVDVMFKTNDGDANLCILTYKIDNGDYFSFHFTCFSREGESLSETYFYGYEVRITKIGNPHPCEVIDHSIESQFSQILLNEGFTNQNFLSPVLQEIDLTGTDAERKDKLAQFEIYWAALTGASDMKGARFMGHIDFNQRSYMCLLSFNSARDFYSGIAVNSDNSYEYLSIVVDTEGYLGITKLFSHLEAIEILTDNSAESNKKNLDNLNAYKSNLAKLGVDTSIGFQVPIRVGNAGGILFRGGTNIYQGFFSHSYIMVTGSGKVSYKEVQLTVSTELVTSHKAIVPAINEVNTLAKAVKAFGAIELKASDNAANKAALTAYKKILTDALTDAGISITNGYSVPVRITGNAQEYHGMLNIGTGTLLSGIVTDANENHHYPFNVNTTDGAITFDANNYFLEKTSNEVTEMLDAIKYSYTPVPLTATTSTNKTQLDLFLSKVPNAQVMHVTYKDVYAGTLHKINGSWYGVLVGESNTIAGQLSIKLQADGTIVEGTT